MRQEDIQNRIIISALSCCIAMVFALIYTIARIGFSIDARLILQTLLLAFFLLSTPVVVNLLLNRLGISRHAWALSTPFIVVYCLAVVVLISAGKRLLGVDISPLIYLTSLVSFIYVLWVFVWIDGHFQKLILIIGSIATGVLFSGMVWGIGHLNPLLEEGIIVAATGHRDVFFHATIAGIFQTYNTPSMGIDGLVSLNYHYGSHWLFAHFASLLDISTLQFYQLGYPIIFLPTMLYSIFLASLELRPYLRRTDTAHLIHKDFIYWSVVIMAVIGIPGVLRPMFIGGESYDVSIMWMALIIPICAHALYQFIHKTSHPTDHLLVIFILPVMIVFAGLLKASHLYLFILAAGYLFLRYRLYLRVTFLFAAALFVAYVLLLYPTGHQAAHIERSTYDYLVILLSRIADFEFFIPFIFSWVYIILRLIAQQVRTLGDLQTYWRDKSLIDVELLLLMVIVSTGALIFLQLGGLSELYIYDIQRYLGTILLLGGLPVLSAINQRMNFKTALKDFRLRDVAVIIACLFILTSAFGTIMYRFERAYQHNIHVRVNVLPEHTNLLSLFRTDMSSEHLETQEYLTLNALNKLATMPLDDKRDALLYIPRSHPYWTLDASRGSFTCTTVSLIAPAITGMALLDGVPAADCTLYAPGYSIYFSPYLIEESFQPILTPDASHDDICNAASERDFRVVWVLNNDHSTNMISCELGR